MNFSTDDPILNLPLYMDIVKNMKYGRIKGQNT